MKFLCRTLLASMFLAASLLAIPSTQLRAQSDSYELPSVVVSISSLKEQLEDAGYLSEAAGFGRIGSIMINSQADEYLRGVNREEAIGVYLYFTEESPEEPTFVAAIPVTDFEEVLDTLSTVGDLDDSSDVKVLSMNGEDLFIVKKGDYAIASNEEDALKTAPSNPVKELGDLPQRFNVALRVFGQRIPQGLRDQAIEAMMEGYQQELQNSGDDIQMAAGELQMAQMESLINETQEFTFGFVADQEKKEIAFEVELIGLDGSKLAEQVAAQKDAAPSRFSGFLIEDAMMNMNFASKMAEDDIQNYRDLLDSVKEKASEEMDLDNLTEEEAEAVEGLFSALMEVAGDTLESGSTDAGAVIMGGETPAIAVGFAAVNATKIEAAVAKLAEVARDADKFNVKLNNGKLNGANLHTASIPIPDGEEEARQLFGDQVDLIVGISDDTVYVAAGAEPLKLLEKAVGNSGAEKAKAGSMVMNFNLTPILELIGQMEDTGVVEMMADVLREDGRDQITIRSKCIENGVAGRFSIEDSILKLISVAAENFGMGF